MTHDEHASEIVIELDVETENPDRLHQTIEVYGSDSLSRIEDLIFCPYQCIKPLMTESTNDPRFPSFIYIQGILYTERKDSMSTLRENEYISHLINWLNRQNDMSIESSRQASTLGERERPATVSENIDIRSILARDDWDSMRNLAARSSLYMGRKRISKMDVKSNATKSTKLYTADNYLNENINQVSDRSDVHVNNGDDGYVIKPLKSKSSNHQTNIARILENIKQNSEILESAFENRKSHITIPSSTSQSIEKFEQYRGLANSSMNGTKIETVKMSIGSKYVFCHHGCCEHILHVKSMRKVGSLVDSNHSKYHISRPSIPSTPRPSRICEVCDNYDASYFTLEDRLADRSPCFFCE